MLQEYTEFQLLIELGYCTIHAIHSCYGKDMEEHGKNIDQLCFDLYSLFKYRAARDEYRAARDEGYKEVHI